MDFQLQCPACGEANLHHHEVIVCNRSREDGPGVRVTVSDQEVTKADGAADGRAFAGRRNDVRIRFTCEHCPKVSWLYLVQHKGDTYLKWLDTGDGTLDDKSVGRVASAS
jgi:hypothetical protein